MKNKINHMNKKSMKIFSEKNMRMIHQLLLKKKIIRKEKNMRKLSRILKTLSFSHYNPKYHIRRVVDEKIYQEFH
jgi:hypothetical protein